MRRRNDNGDEGFTLVELMMVVAVLGVLIAVAIPHFLGIRHAAQDRAAHTDLRNVLLAERLVWFEQGSYTADFATLRATRPGSLLNADPRLGVFVDISDSDDQVACLVRVSGSGRVFSIWENPVAGTYFGTTDLSAADCPAVPPDGFDRGGF